MWEVTRKGLLAHKFRLLLTSISIVLGVAFVAGTFVFTDTIGSVFDHLFTQTTSGVDAAVRYLEQVSDDTRLAAERYVRRAPPQVRTAIRRGLERRLGWTTAYAQRRPAP